MPATPPHLLVSITVGYLFNLLRHCVSINRGAFQRRRDFLSPSFTPRVQRQRIQIAPDLTSGGRHDIKEQRSREGAGEIKEYERKQKGARSHFIFLFPRRRRRLMETLIVVGFFLFCSRPLRLPISCGQADEGVWVFFFVFLLLCNFLLTSPSLPPPFAFSSSSPFPIPACAH